MRKETINILIQSKGRMASDVEKVFKKNKLKIVKQNERSLVGSVKGHPKYGIYAATWKKTDIYFPMDWKPGVDKYFAVDVTSRYQDFLDSDFIPLRIKVVDLNGERKRILVSVSGDNNFSFVGYSKDEKNDANDHLTLNLPRGNSFTIKVNQYTKTVILNKEELIEIKI